MTQVTTTRVLRGRLGNICTEETTIDFFISDSDRTGMGVTGVAAAAAGLSGLAAGMAGMSLDETKELVSKVSFDIDGVTVEGVFWTFPFKSGDEVEVVAEPFGDGYRAFAVARPKDRIVAMYPYAWAGSVSHYKRSFFVWLLVSISLFLLSSSVFAIFKISMPGSTWGEWAFLVLTGWGALSVFLGFVGFRISRRLLLFSRIAEGAFAALGWNNPKHINLRQQTKRNLKPGDPLGLGEQFFRY